MMAGAPESRGWTMVNSKAGLRLTNVVFEVFCFQKETRVAEPLPISRTLPLLVFCFTRHGIVKSASQRPEDRPLKTSCFLLLMLFLGSHVDQVGFLPTDLVHCVVFARIITNQAGAPS